MVISMKSRPGVTRKCCQTSWDIFLVLQIGLTICAMLKGGEGEMRIFHHIDRAGAERLSQSHILGPTDSRPDSSLTHRLTDSDWACPALHPWIQRRSPPPPPPKKRKRNARGDRIESPSSVRPSPSAPPFFSYSLPFPSLSVPFPPLPLFSLLKRLLAARRAVRVLQRRSGVGNAVDEHAVASVQRNEGRAHVSRALFPFNLPRGFPSE